MEDKHIIALLWQRQTAALEALAKRFGARLLSLAFHILHSRQDAEEVVNDTWLALWNQIPPQKPEPLSGYVYQTGRNQALNRLRHNHALKRGGDYDLSLEELAEVIPGPCLEELVQTRELGRAIDRFLDTVSREDRVLFLRRHWFGDSIKDLSRVFGIRENTLTVRLKRLRQRLGDYLQQEGYTHGN